jgi:hypothetical protein
MLKVLLKEVSKMDAERYDFIIWLNSPTRARAASFLAFLDHTK